MNMEYWLKQQINEKNKKAMPLISYPSAQLMQCTVDQLVHDPRLMAMGMRLLCDRYDTPFAGSYMDLSVEAEAFGANCVFRDDEIPTITGKFIETQEQADALVVPEIGAGRTKLVVDGVKKAISLIKDRPVFANCIGPFSLAGRLMDVNEILLETLEDPDLVHTVLEKATEFIRKFIATLKATGANGVIMAEPLAGLLSPGLMQEFSTDYVRKLSDEFQDKEFLIVYHNCSDGIERKMEQVINTGCKMFHFGDKANMHALLEGMPDDVVIMGNVSPAAVFKADSSNKMFVDTTNLLIDCMHHDNFMISSGCDIPADTDLANIDKFFEAVEIGYKKGIYWELVSDDEYNGNFVVEKR